MKRKKKKKEERKTNERNKEWKVMKKMETYFLLKILFKS